MKIHLFYKPGELEFKLKVKELGHTLEYVGDDENYWYKDTDFIAEDGTAIEVKWDSWINTTNNLFIETANPRSKNGKGWYNFIEAEWLAYGNSRINEFYMINMQDLRNYINTYNPNSITTGDGAQGYLIQLKEIPYKTI